MTLNIETTAPPKTGPCPCCGRMGTSLTRFVYRDGDAYAIYYARFSEDHPDRHAIAAVSLGSWDEDATPDLRVAFILKLSSAAARFQVQVLDAVASLWPDSTILGRALDRTEALSHPLLPEIYAITDQMFVQDPSLRAYLER
jgi:hypothetical protein